MTFLDCITGHQINILCLNECFNFKPKVTENKIYKKLKSKNIQLSRDRLWVLLNVIFTRIEVNVECFPQICWNWRATLVLCEEFQCFYLVNLYPNLDYITASPWVTFLTNFSKKIDSPILTPPFLTIPWVKKINSPLLVVPPIQIGSSLVPPLLDIRFVTLESSKTTK